MCLSVSFQEGTFPAFLPISPLSWCAWSERGKQAELAAVQMWIPDGLQAGPRRLMQAVSVSEELEDVFVLLCVPSLPRPQTTRTHACLLPRPPGGMCALPERCAPVVQARDIRRPRLLHRLPRLRG